MVTIVTYKITRCNRVKKTKGPNSAWSNGW